MSTILLRPQCIKKFPLLLLTWLPPCPVLHLPGEGCLQMTNKEYKGSGLPRGCFTNISWALQNVLSKFVHCENGTSCENVKLKLYTCAQSHALGTRTKYQLEILNINVISGSVYFRDIILEGSQNVSETTPRSLNRKWLGNGTWVLAKFKF